MKKFNYGWIIVGVGALVKMSGLGFGRFAYPMLLPNMKESLRFNYAQMGFLSGGILLGYLLFSFVGGILATRFGSKRVVIASLLCGSISMFFISRLSAFLPLLFFAFAMGGGGAGAHISMTTLPMSWFEKRILGVALGIVTGGTGLGIIITGLFLPPLLIVLGSEAWRKCWMLLGLITFAVAVIGFFLLKEKRTDESLTSAEGDRAKEAVIPSLKREKQDMLSLRAIFVIYFIFGFAYNIYATYFVAFLVEEVRLAESLAGIIWSLFGWTCMISGLIWGFISDRMGRRKALLWNHGVIALSVLLPLCFHQTILLSLSACLFGITFLGTVTVIAAAVGDQVGEEQASVYGLVTLVHGIGQFLGTTSGGYLKDLTGSFHLTLLVSLVGFSSCFVLTAFNKKG